MTDTRTVTAEGKPPPPPKTDTKTVTAPSPTTTVSNETTVHATTEESGGLPWWGWLLIVLGVAAIGIGMYLVGRRRRRGDEPGNGAGEPGEPGNRADQPRSAGLSDEGIPDTPPWPKPPSERL